MSSRRSGSASNGYAYVIDRQGRLVAHPDISLVLRGTDMSKLAQVEEVLKSPDDLAGQQSTAIDARNRNGVPVLSAHAVIQSLNWIVFVELPIAEAQQPVIDSGLRDLALLVLGLLIAGAAGALLARRMVVPIRAMQESAQRIGGGDLGHRMSIKTGDELEALANQFNRSAESAAGLLRDPGATGRGPHRRAARIAGPADRDRRSPAGYFSSRRQTYSLSSRPSPGQPSGSVAQTTRTSGLGRATGWFEFSVSGSWGSTGRYSAGPAFSGRPSGPRRSNVAAGEFG